MPIHASVHAISEQSGSTFREVLPTKSEDNCTSPWAGREIKRFHQINVNSFSEDFPHQGLPSHWARYMDQSCVRGRVANSLFAAGLIIRPERTRYGSSSTVFYLSTFYNMSRAEPIVVTGRGCVEPQCESQCKLVEVSHRDVADTLIFQEVSESGSGILRKLLIGSGVTVGKESYPDVFILKDPRGRVSWDILLLSASDIVFREKCYRGKTPYSRH
ncbi:hypothetical protein RRG08_045593 [Elysia crispata]|uniref:Uncharacterized protein n=1 Tax=Elysia crispata TaxID=231223 RepID=A0AAE1DWW9_9GAST|nr:hypothetical protein RRG08_045593 [Elysia crispata]